MCRQRLKLDSRGIRNMIGSSIYERNGPSCVRIRTLLGQEETDCGNRRSHDYRSTHAHFYLPAIRPQLRTIPHFFCICVISGLGRYGTHKNHQPHPNMYKHIFFFLFFFLNTTQAWKQLLKVKYLCLLQWTPAIMFFWNWSGSSPILYRYETRKTSDRLQVYGISFINLFACGQRGEKCDSNLRSTAKFVCMSTILPARHARGCGENTRGNKIK